jgi:hypothetical protein
VHSATSASVGLQDLCPEVVGSRVLRNVTTLQQHYSTLRQNPKDLDLSLGSFYSLIQSRSISRDFRVVTIG